MFYRIKIDISTKSTGSQSQFIAQESLTYKSLLQNIGRLIFNEFKEHGDGNFNGVKSSAIEEGELDIKYYLPSGAKVYVGVEISQIQLIQ